MSEPQIDAISIRPEASRTWTTALAQGVDSALTSTGKWAGQTAQRFGSLLSALMGPAVFSAYAFALWSLAENLGWTDSFPYATGPLSNWFIWSGIAILVTLAAGILKRHTRSDNSAN